MAKVVRFIDDVTGKEIGEDEGGTVSFSLQGEFYEVDISNETLAKLEKALKPYLDVATSVEAPTPEPVRRGRGPAKRVAAQGGVRNDKDYLAGVRAWARENGYELADRGRIKAEIMEAYEAAS